MPAIRVHHTDTDTESDWDGPGEEAAAANDAGTLRYMHAWEDPDGEPEVKSTYKFPHHAAGDDIPANINGVNNALARLSQADIPTGDRAGVESHLRAHRVDAGLEDNAAEDLLNTQRKSRREPIRCFEGSARPHEPFWSWRNALDEQVETDSEPELELYGYISEYSWFEDEITPKMFKRDLEINGKGGPITIRLNSYGGDVIAASLISTMIRDYAGRVTVRIDGIAASAATVVAVAGDMIKIQDTAYFMIHDPLAVFFLAALNIEELTRMADSLKAVKEGIVNAYETKTGLSRPRLSKMMTEETWMDAQKAYELGFVDEVIKNEKPIPINLVEKAAVVNSYFMNIPAKLLAPAPPQAESVFNAAAERLRAEVKLFQNYWRIKK
jgi:ATP-dependent Clp protease protease subunit